MRYLVIIGLFFQFQAAAQVKLSGVNVKIEEVESHFLVKTTYKVDIPENGKSLKIKALSFGNSIINEVKVESMKIDLEESSDMTTLILNPTTETESFTVSYRVTTGEKGEIPIFFGEWQSTSSDQDFFQVRMSVPTTTHLLFPTEYESQEERAHKIFVASLPAAVSMIRVEQNSDAGALFIKRVDQFVIVTFLIIGVLIWFNRKRVIYG